MIIASPAGEIEPKIILFAVTVSLKVVIRILNMRKSK